jgi:branched-chain amino acid transport system ATP-binding protein
MNLVLDSVCKAWGGVQVLVDIDLSFASTEITGLIGPNGAGKSTLFGVISGNVAVDRGTIRFGHHLLDPLDAAQRARCGLLRTFQVPRPFANLSVRDNLAMAAPGQEGESLLNVFFRPAQVRRREVQVRAHAEQIIEAMNLGRVASHAASQLSGGQLKLLELGRLLMTRPKLVLLDEPFAGVNPVLAEELAEHIRMLNKDGLGFIIVEHDLGALSRLASKMFAMDRGMLIARGTPDEVLSHPLVRAAYVGGT